MEAMAARLQDNLGAATAIPAVAAPEPVAASAVVADTDVESGQRKAAEAAWRRRVQHGPAVRACGEDKVERPHPRDGFLYEPIFPLRGKRRVVHPAAAEPLAEAPQSPSGHPRAGIVRQRWWLQQAQGG